MNSTRRRRSGLFGLVAASALDAAIVIALLASAATGATLAALLLGHAVIAAAQGALLPVAVRPRPRSEALGLALAGVALSFFVPVLGSIGLWLALWFSSRTGRARQDEPYVRLPVDLQQRRPRGLPVVTVPGLAAVLNDRSAQSAHRRFTATLRIEHLPRRAGIQLLKTALKDPVEEIRLFAFSRIERLRNELEEAIKEFRGSLDLAENDEARAHLHLRLAETYWEFAYLGLVEGAVLEHALASALNHVNECRKLDEDAAPASFLHGRILLTRLDFQGATSEFERAARLGYAAAKVLPYLAECAFYARAFGEVRAYLHRLEQVSYGHAPLTRVREFWR